MLINLKFSVFEYQENNLKNLRISLITMCSKTVVLKNEKLFKFVLNFKKKINYKTTFLVHDQN